MMYRNIFGFYKWESVRCFINGIGRLDFEHVYYLLRCKLLTGDSVCENTVVIMDCYKSSSAVLYKFCYNLCVNLDESFYLLKQQVL